MKGQLINILNNLNAIEVKGQSVMILGGCMQQIANIINQLDQEERNAQESVEQSDENPEEK